MGVMVTYCVSDASTVAMIEAGMVARGYARSWTVGGVTHRLPFDSLWKDKVDVDGAISDLRAVAKACDVTLDGAMAAESEPWAPRE